MERDEAELLLDLQSKDAATRDKAMRTISKRFARKVQGLAMAILGDKHLIQDVEQEVFLTLCENSPSIKESVWAWLQRTTRNKSIDQLRRKKSKEKVDSESLNGQGPVTRDLEEQVTQRAKLHSIMKLLENRLESSERLTELQRVCILEVRVLGKTQQEVALSLGRSVNSVSSAIREGTTKIKAFIDGNREATMQSEGQDDA